MDYPLQTVGTLSVGTLAEALLGPLLGSIFGASLRKELMQLDIKPVPGEPAFVTPEARVSEDAIDDELAMHRNSADGYCASQYDAKAIFLPKDWIADRIGNLDLFKVQIKFTCGE